MNKAFKIRIYPNKEQKVLIDKTFGCARYVYNFMLNLKKKLYKNFNVSLNFTCMSKVLTELKDIKYGLKRLMLWHCNRVLKI